MAPTTLTRLRRGITVPVVLLVAWWAAFRFGWTQTTFYVSPGRVADAARALVASGELWHATLASVSRGAAGFAAGAIAGVIIGAALGISPLARRLIEPTLRVPAGISTFAWIPLIIAWFGLGEYSKIVFIAIAAFFPVLINTLEGVAGIPRHYVDVARVFGFTPVQVFLRVVLPAASTSIFSGIYLALITAWSATLAAEYLMTSVDGIGKLLIDGQQAAAMDQAILAAALAGFIGIALHGIASAVENRLQRHTRPEAPHA
jgi:sulfonate transport system permease protein